MNERIKELALKAEDYAFDESNRLLDSDETVFKNRVFFKSFTERFAELIVKECIQQAHAVSDLRGTNDDMIYGADTAALRISKHFGVEE